MIMNLKDLGKRGLALFLALVMCIGMMNLTVLAAESESYDCGQEEHDHTSACYETKRLSDETICGKEEGEGVHEHSDGCYSETESLSCTEEETEGHTHGDACYTTETRTVEKQRLTCGEAETEGHSHSDSCYTVTEARELTCGEAESEGVPADEDSEAVPAHSHSDGCYTVTEARELTCGETETEGHSHSDACYAAETEEVEEKVLSCEISESEGHTHSGSCYARDLVCEEAVSQGHQHGTSCYETEELLVCGLEEHTHSLECCPAYRSLAAGLEEFLSKMDAFQEAYYANLTEDSFNEDGELTEEAMAAFMAEAASQLGGDLKALKALEAQIPVRFAGDAGYQELAATLELYAGLVDGGLGAVELITDGDKANQNITVAAGETWNGNYTLNDGKSHTLSVNGTMNGTVKVTKGTLTIEGSGIIDGQGKSSVITVAGGTINLKGCTITNGSGQSLEGTYRKPYGKVGGGVYIGAKGVLNMSGGTISGNTCNTGGGIFIDNVYDYNNHVNGITGVGTLNMTGGTISGNTATDHEGGGIWCWGKANIEAAEGETIYIHGNKTETTADFGGGGIFINSGGEMTIKEALITNNTAQAYGGGVAGCTNGKVVVSVTSGAAIYDNYLAATTEASKKSGSSWLPTQAVEQYFLNQQYNNIKGDCGNIYSLYEKDLLTFGENAGGWKDYYCARSSIVVGDMLGGGNANWQGTWTTKAEFFDSNASSYGKGVALRGVTTGTIPAGGQQKVFGLMGLTANPDAHARKLAKEAAKVIISENESGTNGGGITCNGVLYLGENPKGESGYNDVNFFVEATKKLTNGTLADKQFAFQLVNDDDPEDVVIAANDKDGSVILRGVISKARLDAAFGAAAKEETRIFTYTMSEVKNEDDSGIVFDEAKYTVSVAVKKVDDNTNLGQGSDTGNSQDRKIYELVGVTVKDQKGETVSGEASFTNKQLINLTVEKKVNGGDYTYNDQTLQDNKFTIQVKLGNGSGKQISGGADEYPYEVNGVYTFTLADGEKAVITDIDKGTAYEVGEIDMPQETDSAIYEKDGILNGEGTLNESVTATVQNKLKEYGQLTLKKTLVNNGNAQVPGEWTFHVTLDGEAGIYDGKEFTEGNITIAPGEEKTITKIPVGTKYTVRETGVDSDEYTVEGEVDGNEIIHGSNNVTITNTRKYVDLTVRKEVSVPSASQEPDPNQRFTIKVTLAGDSADQGTFTESTVYAGPGVYTFQVKAGEGNALQLTGIPAGISYKVEESQIPAGYEQIDIDNAENGKLTDDAAVTVKNRYFVSQTIRISGEKRWEVNEVDELIPADITVTLYRDGKEYKTTKTNDKWEYSFDDLPRYADYTGKEYTYTVKETLVNYGVNAEKMEEYLNKLNETFGLKIDAGRPVVEEKIDGVGTGYFKIYGTRGEVLGAFHVQYDGYTIINHWVPAGNLGSASFQVKKVDAKDGELLDGAEFTLYNADGSVKAAQTTGVDGIAMFGNLKSGVYTLKETKAPAGHVLNGTEWTVEVKEDSLNEVKVDCDDWKWANDWNWIASITEMTGGVLEVRNDRVQGKISVAKKLSMDGNDPGEAFAGKEYVFEVYAGSVLPTNPDVEPAAVLTVKADGKAAVSKLLDYGPYVIVERPAAEIDGYKWTGVEYMDLTDGEEPRGMVLDGSERVAYLVMVQNQDETIAVTASNRYERDLGGISVAKTVTGNRGDREREWTFDITLTAPAPYVTFGASYDTVLKSTTANAEGDVPADVAGHVTLKTPLAVALEKAEAAWNAEQAKLPEADRVAFNAAEWTAAHEAEFPAATSDGREIRVATVTLKHGQSISINSLPVDVAYSVSEAQANQDGYTTTPKNEEGIISKDEISAVEFENYNNYTSSRPRTVNVTVNKVWVGDEEANRPASITVLLFRDGQRYASAELSADNNWTYTWRDLSEDSEWSVGEPSVPEGYTSEVSQNGNSFTVTNTFEETEVPDEPPPLDERPDIPNEDVNLPPEEEIVDEEVPLAQLPEEEIPDEDIPLANIPMTGDSTGRWGALSLLSAAALLGLSILGRKKGKED